MAEKAAIPFDDFLKLDLRVATVTGCEAHPNADRLLKIRLDDGTEDGRQVCAGIRPWYAAEELVGKQVVLVANLEPRKIRGEVSHGMLLAATEVKATDEGGEATEQEVVILTVDGRVKAGSAVS